MTKGNNTNEWTSNEQGVYERVHRVIEDMKRLSSQSL